MYCMFSWSLSMCIVVTAGLRLGGETGSIGRWQCPTWCCKAVVKKVVTRARVKRA